MAKSLAKEFGVVRSFLWPIHRHETKKIVPMLLICFLICMNYSILRNLKDTVVVDASGARVIPYIKVWALLPMAVCLTFCFTKLSNKLSQERVFYLIISGFLIFFALFSFVLYPMQESIHPHQLAKNLERNLPQSFYGLIEMFRYWSLTLFYVIAEMWSSIVYSVLFMGFANEITKIGEARRFYTVLSVGSNLGAIIAGLIANFFVKSDGEFNANLMTLTWIVILSGIVVMVIFKWMNRNVLKDPSFDELHYTRRELKKKKKLSVRESFSYLSNSRYLVCIAIVVVAYNLTQHLVEIIWKDQLDLLHPNRNDFNWYLNMVTICTGIVSTFTSFFMARMIGRFGWTKTALITPTVILITSIGFFTFYFFQDSLAPILTAMLGVTPLAVVVFFGAVQNCLSKAAKYSVFDATKEMTFIPLPHEIKLRGKAAIDGIGSRFGKSGGSIMYQALFVFFASVSRCAPYVATLLMAAIGGWIVAVRFLGVQLQKIVETNNEGGALEIEGAVTPSTKEERPATA